MSRHLGIAALGGLCAAVLATVVAIAYSGDHKQTVEATRTHAAAPMSTSGPTTLTDDPSRSVEVAASEAAALVSAFVGSPALADRLSVRGPTDGPYRRTYDVAGNRVRAIVDAHTGEVVTLLIGSAIGVDGEVKVSAADARTTAEWYLTARGIAVDGLVQSTRFVNHGEYSEYRVEWTHEVNGVVVPDYRLVGVDAATGQVFRYINIHTPFDPPGEPSIAEIDAIARAVNLMVQDAVHVDRTELRVDFTVTGVQRLVWHVFLTESVDAAAAEPVPGHWVVEVDAASGEAVLLAGG